MWLGCRTSPMPCFIRQSNAMLHLTSQGAWIIIAALHSSQLAHSQVLAGPTGPGHYDTATLSASPACSEAVWAFLTSKPLVCQLRLESCEARLEAELRHVSDLEEAQLSDAELQVVNQPLLQGSGVGSTAKKKLAVSTISSRPPEPLWFQQSARRANCPDRINRARKDSTSIGQGKTAPRSGRERQHIDWAGKGTV